MSSNETAQEDELLAIESIYPEILRYDGEKRIILQFPLVRITVTLPQFYPSHCSPIYELSAPTFQSAQQCKLRGLINDMFQENVGMPVLFTLITTVNEFCEDLEPVETVLDSPEESLDSIETFEESTSDHDLSSKLDIKHGDVFSDRKSHFQAHLCAVHSKDEIDEVMANLLSNNKIAKATHNIVAWRIKVNKNGKEILAHDCEDDGETGASSKMLDLMDKIDAVNVIVVVTRWYGGIHLGPDRFRHINNLTREILAQYGYDKRSAKKS